METTDGFIARINKAFNESKQCKGFRIERAKTNPPDDLYDIFLHRKLYLADQTKKQVEEFLRTCNNEIAFPNRTA